LVLCKLLLYGTVQCKTYSRFVLNQHHGWVSITEYGTIMPGRVDDFSLPPSSAPWNAEPIPLGSTER